MGYGSTYMYLHTHTCNICIRACFPPMDLRVRVGVRGNWEIAAMKAFRTINQGGLNCRTGRMVVRSTHSLTPPFAPAACAELLRNRGSLPQPRPAFATSAGGGSGAGAGAGSRRCRPRRLPARLAEAEASRLFPAASWEPSWASSPSQQRGTVSAHRLRTVGAAGCWQGRGAAPTSHAAAGPVSCPPWLLPLP